jgi:hypothetical protein
MACPDSVCEIPNAHTRSKDAGNLSASFLFATHFSIGICNLGIGGGGNRMWRPLAVTN